MAQGNKVTVLRRISDGMVFPNNDTLRSTGRFEEAKIEPGKGTDCLDEKHNPVGRVQYQKELEQRRKERLEKAEKQYDFEVEEAKVASADAAINAERNRNNG